jgi:hypothetical protein
MTEQELIACYESMLYVIGISLDLKHVITFLYTIHECNHKLSLAFLQPHFKVFTKAIEGDVYEKARYFSELIDEEGEQIWGDKI